MTGCCRSSTIFPVVEDAKWSLFAACGGIQLQPQRSAEKAVKAGLDVLGLSLIADEANIGRPPQVFAGCIQTFFQRLRMNEPSGSLAANASPLSSDDKTHADEVMITDDPDLNVNTNNYIVSPSSNNGNLETLTENRRPRSLDQKQLFCFRLVYGMKNILALSWF